ncbi:hypothetical protein G6F61_015186 [Rhizopus arrhizus]|nr:hypothetical protein G6F61_015186 [Rhizopus arrhizus]
MRRSKWPQLSPFGGGNACGSAWNAASASSGRSNRDCPSQSPKSSSSHSSSASTSRPRAVASAIAVCSERSRGELITRSHGCAA